MIGATAKAEQFYQRSGSESTKGSRKGFSLLGGGDNPLDYMTDEQKRDSLVKVWKGLQVRIEEAKKHRNKAEIANIGRQISECGLAINAIRAKRRSAPDVAQFFIDVCRETMTRPQFNSVMDEANKRLRTFNRVMPPAPGTEGE